MARSVAASLLTVLGCLGALALLPAPAQARADLDLLRLKGGREILIRPGWDASYEHGSFWFEYVRPHRLACTLPLEDVAEIQTADGTIYENTYEPPAITFSNRAILNVQGTIIQHGSLYQGVPGGSANSRGWNSRTGQYEAP